MIDILDIPGLSPISSIVNEPDKTLIIEAKISKELVHSGECPHCGASGRIRLWGKRHRRYRDIPSRGYRVLIKLESQRYSCNSCKKSFCQIAVGMDPKRSMTLRCSEWIAQQSLVTTSSHVAEQVGCSQKTVMEIAFEYIRKQERKSRRPLPSWLGITEVHFGRKMKGRWCVLIDLEDGQIVEMLPNCSQSSIRAWLLSFKGSLQFRGACIGMCAQYRTALKGAFPGAEIVVDKAQMFRAANDAVNRAYMRSKVAAGEKRFSVEWKQVRSLLPSRRSDLLDHERRLLDSWIRGHKDISEAYRLKEEFLEIYECKQRRDAELALDRWEHNVPANLRSQFKELLFALKSWRKEILAYFGNEKSLELPEVVDFNIKQLCRAKGENSFEMVRGKVLFGRIALRSSRRRLVA